MDETKTVPADTLMLDEHDAQIVAYALHMAMNHCPPHVADAMGKIGERIDSALLGRNIEMNPSPLVSAARNAAYV